MASAGQGRTVGALRRGEGLPCCKECSSGAGSHHALSYDACRCPPVGKVGLAEPGAPRCGWLPWCPGQGAASCLLSQSHHVVCRVKSIMA